MKAVSNYPNLRIVEFPDCTVPPFYHFVMSHSIHNILNDSLTQNPREAKHVTVD